MSSNAPDKQKPEHPHGTPPGQDPEFTPGEDVPGQDKPQPQPPPAPAHPIADPDEEE